MFCKNCGTKSDGTKKFCINCGKELSSATKSQQVPPTPNFTKPKFESSWGAGRIIGIIIIVAFVGWGIYSSQDDTAIDTNNNAINAYDSGNSEQAIIQFQQASQDAVTNDTKIGTLKNLGYAYSTEGKNDEALNSFQQALALTSQNSFDYYLISGEIALLQAKPNAALVSFNKALALEPDDFQLNNALALFYLNADGSTTAYEDYPRALTFALKANNLNNSETTRQNLGIAYYANDKYDLAISTLSQSNLTQHPYIAYWLGMAYAQKEDVIKAKYYFNIGINAGVDMPQEVYDYIAEN